MGTEGRDGCTHEQGISCRGLGGCAGGEGGGGVPSDKTFLRVPSYNIFCALKTFVVLLEKILYFSDRTRRHLTSSLCHHEISSVSAPF